MSVPSCDGRQDGPKQFILLPIDLLLKASGKKKKLSLGSGVYQSASRTGQACIIHDENAGVAPIERLSRRIFPFTAIRHALS